ncbi:hypothetical protein AAE478_007719 [Parahypoxylon ruwenzoriense]
MSRQAAEALHFLYANGIRHGDFRPGDILVKLANLDHLSKADLFSILGQPEQFEIRTESGVEHPPISSYLWISRLGPDTIGPACDIWALECSLLEIQKQIPLFYMINDPDELLAEMVGFFGKLPERLWAKWDARGNFFTEDGSRACTRGDVDGSRVHTFEIAPGHKIDVIGSGNGEKTQKVLAIPPYEHTVLGDILYKVFCYDPEQRPSVEEALKHD